MKRNRQVGQRIKGFRENHYSNQKALADALGVGQTVVSAWERGDNTPSSEAWIKLASLAPSRDKLWFLEQAGLRRETIIAAATALGEDILVRPKEGDTVLIPRFRATEHGREEAGPPLALSAEYVPNPLATAALLVDEKSDGVIESPRGLLLVDTSCQGAEDLHDLWGRVVALYFAPQEAVPGAFEEGLYVGRLLLSTTARSFIDPNAPKITGFLQYISFSAESQTPSIHSLFVGLYTEHEGFRRVPPEDGEGWSRQYKEFESRAHSAFRLLKGIRIVGKVIGRLTGHLEGQSEQP